MRTRLGGLALACLVACAITEEAAPAPPEVASKSAREGRSASAAPELPDGAFIEVLGVAQDAGVPQAACTSPNCERAREDPAQRRLATSLALVGGSGSTYLFEATPDIRPQLDRVMELGKARRRPDVGRKYVDGIFLTHAHMGHYTGLMHLGFEAAHAQGVPLWASEKMVEFLAANQPWKQLVALGNVAPVKVPFGESVKLDEGLTARPIKVPHRDELSDTVAWRIEGPHAELLFLPDCHPWERWDASYPSLDELLEGVDVLLVDGTFFSGDELPGRDLSKIGHPMVVDTLERLGARVAEKSLRVVFIHFNHSNPLAGPHGEAHSKVESAGFEVAARGMQIPI